MTPNLALEVESLLFRFVSFFSFFGYFCFSCVFVLKLLYLNRILSTTVHICTVGNKTVNKGLFFAIDIEQSSYFFEFLFGIHVSVSEKSITYRVWNILEVITSELHLKWSPNNSNFSAKNVHVKCDKSIFMVASVRIRWKFHIPVCCPCLSPIRFRVDE